MFELQKWPLWCFLERNGVDISFWPTRFNICLGIAHGLFYLHEIAQPRIIHRDIKASNILLDKRLQPKIADFGLALLFADDKTHISTMHVAGTRYCIDLISTFFRIKYFFWTNGDYKNILMCHHYFFSFKYLFMVEYIV
jgi:serine/threonine protein kinase